MDLERESWAKLTPLADNLESISLTKDSYTLGRMPKNDIQLQDVRLSGVHCRIFKDADDNIWVEDLSTNGTFLGDDKIGKGKQKKLASGDKIYLVRTDEIIVGYLFSSQVGYEKED